MTEDEFVFVAFYLMFIFLFLFFLYDYFVQKRVSKNEERIDELEFKFFTFSSKYDSFQVLSDKKFSDLDKRLIHISVMVDNCFENIDSLFDRDLARSTCIDDLNHSIDCINCKLQNPLRRFLK